MHPHTHTQVSKVLADDQPKPFESQQCLQDTNRVAGRKHEHFVMLGYIDRIALENMEPLLILPRRKLKQQPIHRAPATNDGSYS